jgi:hypothetical protein
MGYECIETALRYADVKPQSLENALVRVGEHQALSAENTRISAEIRSPTGGGIGQFGDIRTHFPDVPKTQNLR